MKPAWLPVVAALLFACSGESEHDEHDEHDEHSEEAHVAHAARYGGHLVEIGEHAAQVELVHEREAGRLTAYVWDSCVEQPVRLAAERIEITLDVAGEELPFALVPVADPLTGEKVGDTSRFETRSDTLKGLESFHGRIGELEIKGVTFAPTRFELGEGHEEESESHDEDGDEHAEEGGAHR